MVSTNSRTAAGARPTSGAALLVAVALSTTVTSAANINLYIHYPNASLNANWLSNSRDCCYAETLGAECSCYLFGVDYQACATELHTAECPGALAAFDKTFQVGDFNFIGNDTWMKALPLGDNYSGYVTVDIYAPQVYGLVNNELRVSSSVTDCYNNPAAIEMSPELCQQTGNPWTVAVSAGVSTDLHVYPGFGFFVGKTEVILNQFYSPQLDNHRNVSVFVPASILNNGLKRKVDVLVLLDGSDSVVDSFATRGGFEAAQASGRAPESIMIGITALEFAYDFNFDQRTYELTYAFEDNAEDSCISGARTGGSDLLLAWIDEDVIPAVLNKVGIAGMLRGDVTLAGGSLGGLTSCYGAASRPETFQRAICLSPSNCFRYAHGSLVPTIKNLTMLPKAVFQFLGAEVIGDTYDSTSRINTIFDNQTQLNFLMREDAAWKSMGMQPLNFTQGSFVGKDTVYAQNPYPWATIGNAPDNMIMSFHIPGGQHSPWTWQQEFNFALNYIYRANRTYPLRIPFQERLQYLSVSANPTDFHCADDGDDKDGDDGLTFKLLLSLSIILFFGLVVESVLLFQAKRTISNRDTKRKMPMSYEVESPVQSTELRSHGKK